MKPSLNNEALNQLFNEARTIHVFQPSTISDEQIKALYNLMKWAPTAFNGQHGRFIFLRSAAAKDRLKPALSPNNIPQVDSAAVTVIVAYDSQFYEHLPKLFPAFDAKPIYENNADLSHENGFRNSALQGAFLIMAVRALGLDCGAMSGFDAAKVNAIFFPDGRHQVNFLLNIGIADPQGLYPRGPRFDFAEVAEIL